MEKAVKIEDKKYPKSLKEIGREAPKKLYYKGEWKEEIFENCLAVVGSRHLTGYGKKITEQLVTEIAASGITIVSGFMYGGDEAAHSATVRIGGKTIAVMPCGIDMIHPEYQEKLYYEILENKGLIISELEGKFSPVNWTYARRNRIVAGLSKAILVVEAGLNSGTLITAKYAKKYGRKIFAVPGQITSDVSKGTIKLIKEGAFVVTEASDILKYYNVSPANLSNSESQAKQSSILSKEEKTIIEQLKREPMEADLLSRTLGISAAKVGTTLSLMQLKGFINQESGKYYVN
ncbi:MAG: DNA-protecting protein DprA [Candidatus Staskawiczbacteria bacterium]|nr:DNA-protecting protein DprA [Candidatus Staskawiczbacteria bacterium]MBI3337596.1 DNA-protecting protein DprA [Candidatus Staskawiczbacteria bacterium]